MSYATRANVEALFGVNNVDKWADIENSGAATEIAARIVTALANADSMIDARLRGGRYVVPFTEPIDLVVVEIASKLAGVWLYESRGAQDTNPETGQSVHRLIIHKNDANKMLRDLLSGRLVLTLTKRTMVPEVVKDVT